MSSAVLAVGYLLSVPPLFRLRRILRGRETAWFAAEEAGTALLVAGWAMKGRPAGAVINALWALGLGVVWFRRR